MMYSKSLKFKYSNDKILKYGCEVFKNLENFSCSQDDPSLDLQNAFTKPDSSVYICNSTQEVHT